jgi:hypothetical protein
MICQSPSERIAQAPDAETLARGPISHWMSTPSVFGTSVKEPST